MLRTAATLVFLVATTATAEAQAIAITRASSRSPTEASAETFTGRARIERLFDARDPSDATGGIVTFEAGARTAWHAHPRGQVLIVTSGVGLVQAWGGPIEEVRPGDVVQISAGHKHWHGASPSSPMTHIAIAEHRDGTVVEWMEHVTDTQYGAAAAKPTSQNPPESAPARASGTLQPRIAPGLATLTDDVLFGDLWLRPELSPRDRSLVTVSVLIATGKSAQLTGHLNRALDNGVQPVEASGLLAHLAIYAGWPAAVSALEVFDQVYEARKVDVGTLRAGSASGAPGDPRRREAVNSEFGATAPKFAQLTNDVVFGDLWRRPDLTRRDRSLITIAALAATGDDDQLEGYVRQAIDHGLTFVQISEALTHVGFYAGWGKATKAIIAVGKTSGR